MESQIKQTVKMRFIDNLFDKLNECKWCFLIANNKYGINM